MNKLQLFLLYFILSPIALFAQGDSITIKGQLHPGIGNSANKITLSFTDNSNKKQVFSQKIQSGKFEFKVPKQPKIVDAILRTADQMTATNPMQSPLNLFIGGDNIRIDADNEELQFADVSGGEENNAYTILRQSTATFIKQKNTLYTPILTNEVSSESTEGKSILQQISQLGKKENQLQKQFIKSHPHLYSSLFLLYRMRSSYTSSDYKSAFDELSNTYKSSSIGQMLQARIEKELVTAKGKTAPLFERPTSTGTHFKLENMRGQVVLLDFWGSWCSPCRASMPHLQELYSRYKEKGFEIVGIAQEHGKTLEDSKKTWHKAIQQLNLPWINVLNNENKEQMDIVKAYQISGFPTKILVDKNGKILLRVIASATDDIDIALKEIYGY
ncbi:TlpA disulfide reductase family protein [Sphingobacterium athyrii]|uniref:Thioredoxin domain-containing protein n=1 Tax=Sphingobacterium athyrii TaxID=2152717 RepID=A0A363NMX3_9SPHI|nr:TlpA disulfide reductase family protein [Sphingobacterium athyrii]PUV22124.1 hypothetical protein DCO56_24680 [Sphingobacterium athyrii]